MKIFSMVFTLFLSLISFSQNIVYIGTKAYPATETRSFLKKGQYASYSYNSTLEVTFAKRVNGGCIMLSTGGVFSEDQSIGGTILIYLSNGETLSLSTRLHKDFADEKTTVVYALSSIQIQKLKLYDISKIRYYIISFGGKSGYTAENRYNKSYKPGVYDQGVYRTSEDVASLFD